MPSASGYMVASVAAAGALFFVLWWMLQGEENPWIPAGLAATVVILVAALARGVAMRRSVNRHAFDEERERFDRPVSRRTPVPGRQPSFSQSQALRALEKKSTETNASEALPEVHLKMFQLCGEFLDGSEKSLTTPGLSPERRLKVRARQERVRALQKHHLLTWARDSARSLTHEAQQRARLHEKIETANRALDCIDSARQKYPEDEELERSAAAVREFINSSRVAHWVELAQRASFKGRYRRAIDCYRDALFYLTRAGAGNDHQAAAEQITREIDLLRARLTTHKAVDSEPSAPDRKSDTTL
ncbi:MAG TPA: HIG1 domain-containing protein [Pyrinomonadaceae bacterium]|nr:HIG1 domain-containing protein [Pyrinomonadaceae bacterium]